MAFSLQTRSGDLPLRPRGDYLPALDGLRAVAAIMVLVAHIPMQLFAPRFLDFMWVLNPWYLGVDIFFVLSGFLITRILIADKMAGRPLGYFLIRRALRIFPIYYLLLAIMLFFRPASEIAWCAAYLSNYHFAFHPVLTPLGHFWSLSVEEHFYLLWPWIVYGLSFRQSRTLILYIVIPAAVLMAVAITLGQGYLPSTTLSLIRHGTQCRVASLGLGALFAYHESWLRTGKMRILAVAACLFAAFVIANRAAHYLFAAAILPDVAHEVVTFISFALLSGSLVLAAIYLSDLRSSFSLLLTAAPLRYIGRISYGLYLYHLPIYFALGLYGAHAQPTFLRVAIAIALSFLAAALSFAFIERPILRLKNRFRDAPLPRRAFISTLQPVGGLQ